MISASVNIDKIDKSLIVEKNGKRFFNFVHFENDAPDDYGNNGIIKQSLSKEQRAAGVKAPIIGNWKWMNKPKSDAPKTAPATQPDDSDSGAPF